MTRFPRWIFVAVFVLVLSVQERAKAQSVPASPTALGPSTSQSADPYWFCGRITVVFGPDVYIGSGTVIKPRSVLTCGHILYDPQYGWATNVIFQRAFDEGTDLNAQGNPTTPATRPHARSILILGGYANDTIIYGPDSKYAFSRDMGALRFTNTAANGGYAGYIAQPSLLTSGTPTTMSLGYGGDPHDGRQMLTISSTATYVARYTSAYLLNNSYVIEPGMSGGPVYLRNGNSWFVSGVNVSGNDGGMGMRALNKAGDQFIKLNLR